VYRVVFCPFPEMMEEAEILASETHLPVLIGRNGRLEGVVFDDSKVSVVSVPVDRHVTYQQRVVKAGHLQVVRCVDDYADLSSAVIVVSAAGEEHVHQPVEKEKHMVRFAFRTDREGRHDIVIRNDGGTLFDGSFVVGDGQ
jgi:hypothetical protein